MMGKTIMIQGTASNVGKSVMAAAFCRLLYKKGYKVAPFKAQNMSNNSFVTETGGEIGRAQAVQAEACYLKPTTDMNPILLKPDTDSRAQVVVRGKAMTKITSIGDVNYQKTFQPLVHESLDRLRAEYDVVVIEGAGSPAEMNLKERDLVNMNLAKYAKSPVILVGDIDWGGIFAQLIGTYELLDADEKSLVRAFLINKFRGDQKLLDPGLEWIERETHKPVLGVIPYISDLDIAEEDSIVSGDSSGTLAGLRANVRLDAISGKMRDVRELSIPKSRLLIDVLWLPRISNFTDFDALKKRSDVTLRFLHEPDRHTLPDLIIIPGTKSTIADLKVLKKSGLAEYALRAARAGVTLLGICGGYQMLGKKIIDLEGMESDEKEFDGLGLLPMVTEYEGEKTTKQVRARHLESGFEVAGYEIHMGKSQLKGDLQPLFEIIRREGEKMSDCFEGVINSDKNIMGTYIHGLLDNTQFCDYFLSTLKKKVGLMHETVSNNRPATDALDRLASIVEQKIRADVLTEILEIR